MHQKPTLKYQTFLDDMPSCPPDTARAADFTAFRFVVLQRRDEDNFLPVALLQPSRMQQGNFLSRPPERCSAYGLSFFLEQDKAIARIEALIKRMGLAFTKQTGNAVAQVYIKSSDGLATPPNHASHIDLHEFETAALKHQPLTIVWSHDA